GSGCGTVGPAPTGEAAPGRRRPVTFGSAARRGQPGDFAVRLARVERLLAAPGRGGGAAGPLALVASVLRFQAARSAAPAVVAAAGAVAAGGGILKAAGRFPILDLTADDKHVGDEITQSVTVLTGASLA